MDEEIFPKILQQRLIAQHKDLNPFPNTCLVPRYLESRFKREALLSVTIDLEPTGEELNIKAAGFDIIFADVSQVQLTYTHKED